MEGKGTKAPDLGGVRRSAGDGKEKEERRMRRRGKGERKPASVQRNSGFLKENLDYNKFEDFINCLSYSPTDIHLWAPGPFTLDTPPPLQI